MNTCPCCSETLLRHARHNGVYWFCTHCWQEMPVFDKQTPRVSQLSVTFSELVQALATR